MPTEEERQLFDSAYPLRIGGEEKEGREYEAVMLCDRDWGDLENWIRSRYVALASQAGDQLDQSQRKELLEAAINASLHINAGTTEGNAILNSELGTLRFGWQMCKKRNPDLQFQQFERIARGKEDKYLYKSLSEIRQTYNLLHTKKQEDAGPGGSSTGNDKSL